MTSRIRADSDERLACRYASQTLPMVLAPDGFALPALPAADARTAFLSLAMETTRARRRDEPSIEVEHRGATYRQYFARGVAGVRHLNLSPSLQEPGRRASGRVVLRSDSLRWEGRASLTTFDSPALASATILVLGPHPDDAEIAAFGLYASRCSSSWVVTVTAGERGGMNLSKVAAGPRGDDARWRALLRVWDSVTIPQLGDVPGERAINLVYPDGALETMFRERTRPVALACAPSLSRVSLRARNRDADFQGGSAECTWAGLVAELRLLIDKVKPSLIVCPHPLLDNHPDHVFTTVAVEEALRRSTHHVSSCFLYVVHPRNAHTYPYGSADGIVSVAPWTDEGWVSDTLFSHAVSPELLRAKYFAIEGHHDVRTYGDGEPRNLRRLLGAVKREVLALFEHGPIPGPTQTTATFLRRFVRPNELYYVVSRDSLSELVARRIGVETLSPRGT